ncbi:MAG TPA: heavy metal-binding domain-containing protein [Candidatus Acidoferrales bacterium]|nr:heavy metal-binding domain-containing protein [Candidatus Acidoferrales bacterium]
MKTLGALVLAAAAFTGGYGYGRWYLKPAPAAPKPLYWVDPMHPWYKSDKPGAAPVCGMKLVPVVPGEEARYERRANKLPEGSVQITSEKQQRIGVEYGTAEYETTRDSIRAVARVTLDETRIAKVHSKVDGWIDQVFVRGNGFFEPREVRIGAQTDGRTEIVGGLKPGERIVVSGNFLLDSESQLQHGEAKK